jgi:hypothetical protein
MDDGAPRADPAGALKNIFCLEAPLAKIGGAVSKQKVPALPKMAA